MIPLRIIVAIHALAVLAQAFLAGRFLSGLDRAVYSHEAAGWAVIALCCLQLGVVAILRIPPGRTLPFLLSTVLILLGEALQVGAGYGRFLEVHIPLGALLLAGVAVQLAWVTRK